MEWVLVITLKLTSRTLSLTIYTFINSQALDHHHVSCHNNPKGLFGSKNRVQKPSFGVGRIYIKPKDFNGRMIGWLIDYKHKHMANKNFLSRFFSLVFPIFLWSSACRLPSSLNDWFKVFYCSYLSFSIFELLISSLRLCWMIIVE